MNKERVLKSKEHADTTYVIHEKSVEILQKDKQTAYFTIHIDSRFTDRMIVKQLDYYCGIITNAAQSAQIRFNTLLDFENYDTEISYQVAMHDAEEIRMAEALERYKKEQWEYEDDAGEDEDNDDE